MKKFITTLILIVLPFCVIECSLHNEKIFKEIVSKTPPIEWSRGYMKVNDWPDILIMGTSLARGAIDTDLLEQQLKKHSPSVHVGNISIPSDSHANDYFTLKRILQTCHTCPTKILLSITDIALKDHELEGWRSLSELRITQQYMYDAEEDQVLREAARLDPAYEVIKNNIFLKNKVRFFFLRNAINQYIANVLFFPHLSDKALVLTQNADDPGYGYMPFEQKLTDISEKNSINNYREYLGEYVIGGSGEFFLKKFLEVARDNNIEVVLLITPLSDVYQKAFSKEVTMYSTYLHSLSDQYHILLVDGLDLIPTNHEAYGDTNHLNKSGAEMFTKYLAKEIDKQMLQLPSSK